MLSSYPNYALSCGRILLLSVLRELAFGTIFAGHYFLLLTQPANESFTTDAGGVIQAQGK